MRFFRASFLLLVLANLGFFAWAQGYLGGQEQGREPQRLAGQVEPEKLQVVATTPVVATAAPAAPQRPDCRLVTGLPPAEVEAFKAALAAFSIEIRTPETSTSYWVHIPPQPGKAAAEKKAAELKALGIKDFYIVQEEGPGHNALSLGLFKSEAAANEFLQSLAKRGVKSAKIEVRESTPQQVRALVRGPGEQLDPSLSGLVARIPGAATSACP